MCEVAAGALAALDDCCAELEAACVVFVMPSGARWRSKLIEFALPNIA